MWKSRKMSVFFAPIGTAYQAIQRRPVADQQHNRDGAIKADYLRAVNTYCVIEADEVRLRGHIPDRCRIDCPSGSSRSSRIRRPCSGQVSAKQTRAQHTLREGATMESTICSQLQSSMATMHYRILSKGSRRQKNHINQGPHPLFLPLLKNSHKQQRRQPLGHNRWRTTGRIMPMRTGAPTSTPAPLDASGARHFLHILIECASTFRAPLRATTHTITTVGTPRLKTLAAPPAIEAHKQQDMMRATTVGHRWRSEPIMISRYTFVEAFPVLLF